MDGSRVTELVNKCRSSDVDVKIDAVTKLQSEFEAGVEIPDSETLISTLKACLRTSNQHLTTAAISAIPPLLPLLITNTTSQSQAHPPLSNSTSSSSIASTIDAFSLRQVLLAFLPAGAIIDRLGDTREKAREKARESLIILGGYAFRCANSNSLSSKSRDAKGPETPLAIFDRFLKEAGLGSKVWRIREQSILVLVHIRRSHHLFPIRLYLSALVGALEDTDGNVRECARQSIVEIFTGPGVTDAARTDLKKEMTKKGVRKNTLDSVLSKVLLNSSSSTPQSEGSENDDTGSKKEYVPPSLALAGRRPTVSSNGSNVGAGSSAVSRTVSQSSSRELPRPGSRATTVASPPPTESGSPGGAAGAGATDIRPVFVASGRDLETEFSKTQKHFDGKETEHNWAQREKAIVMVRGMIKGEVHVKYQETFLASLKHFLELSIKTMASLRTTVAVHTCSLYSELAVALGPLLDQHCDLLLTNLLRMAALTKKLVSQQSQAAVATIIKHTSAQPRLIPHLLSNPLQDKTVQTRAFMVDHVKTYLETHAARSKNSIESSGALDILEKCVRKALADANVGVRENARKTFWVFESVWEDRGAAILQGLDGLGRKQLEKACPNPDAVMPDVPSTPSNGKKTSIAAAIAASRAKAKAIAFDPPTLRHQATSASQAAARTTSPAKRAMSPSLSNSSTGRSVSPIQSGSPPRARTSLTGPSSRTSSGGAGASTRSPRPSLSPSSPSASTNNTTSIRRTLSNTTLSSPGTSPTLRKTSHTGKSQSPPPPAFNIVPNTPTPQPRPNARALSSNNREIAARQSVSLAQFNDIDDDDETLLMATKIPIPDGGDSDDEFQPVTFSTPFELYPPPKPTNSKSTTSHSFSTDSPPASTPQPIVEDAMRARAEQAESAAERLLELVEPEEDGAHEGNFPSSLFSRNGHSDNAQPNNWSVRAPTSAPKTPSKKSVAVMRQAALFQDTPVHNESKQSLLDLVKDEKHDRRWWVKRLAFVEHGTPLKGVEPADRIDELQNHISALENGSADLRTLQKIALLCVENPVVDVSLSPLSHSLNFGMDSLPSIGSSRDIQSLGANMWMNGKSCNRLFTSLVQFLDPSKEGDVLEYGLIVLWEMLENQAPYLEGRESDMFTLLLQIRYSNKTNVFEATNAIRDALTTRIEAVYGLTTMHASVRAFASLPHPDVSSADVKAASYAFGLIALAKFILRLPGEILEEELPRLRVTLISALTDQSSLLIRESAAAVIISAQMVIRDEAHLFALLDGLADDKKNLLTYLFERHDARSLTSCDDHSGMDKLEKEMKRLDTRTSTPPRQAVSQ